MSVTAIKPIRPVDYTLITPARNEEQFIELTLKSVIKQTHRPRRWIIVDDGSTDGTAKIVKSHQAQHSWIELVERSAHKERHFAGKVAAFDAGYERARGVESEVVGNLDADLSFDADLFELLMTRFAENPRLGVAGPPFTEGHGIYDFRFSSIEHVSGACQMFRRRCYESIGGYRPLKGGGIDVVAVLMARMQGWQTRTFPERVCFHHRAMGSAKTSTLAISYRLGQKDYMLGRHPLWQLCRALYQMTRPPLVLGGLMLLLGFVGAALRSRERSVPKEMISFQRREQMGRLINCVVGLGGQCPLRHKRGVPD